MRQGLTLGISVVSVGDTAEPLLPGGVPDLGRDGHRVRRRQARGGGGQRAPVLWCESCVGGKAAPWLLCFSLLRHTC